MKRGGGGESVGAKATTGTGKVMTLMSASGKATHVRTVTYTHNQKARGATHPRNAATHEHGVRIERERYIQINEKREQGTQGPDQVTAGTV